MVRLRHLQEALAEAGLRILANPGWRPFYPSNYSTGKKSGYRLNFRVALRLAVPLCGIATSFVMALSSCSRYPEFSGTTSHNQQPDLQSFPHRRRPQARSRLVAVCRSSRAIRKRSRDEERNKETAASHEQYREGEETG